MSQLELNKSVFSQRAEWERHAYVPRFDFDAMCAKTKAAPRWVHFGGGNIFRAFIAELAQQLLDKGEADTGIIASDTFDFEIIDKIYEPYDNLSLVVLMHHDGRFEKKVVASVGEALAANTALAANWTRFKTIFTAPSLQLASFTITEKGYALKGIDGAYFPVVQKDIDAGPAQPLHAMSVVTSLMWERFQKGAAPLALVSMDNCSHNGEKLQTAVYDLADRWCEKGFVNKEFVAYLHDSKKVGFPWSMIDKITPRPAPEVQAALEKDGIVNMAPVITGKKTFIAPFVNAEVPQYLVIEDAFPAGRPALHLLKDSGVYLTDRDTVNKTEQMKVTTCLNPLHTALAVYGCILGAKSIAEEVRNPALLKLISRIGYEEGLPVVVNPGILDPKQFIDEVVQERLPNPFIPDTPQRIATDTSQKVAIRFGETIKSYIREKRDTDALNGISLAIAGWLRYLLAVDDDGKPMELSADPMLETLAGLLQGIAFGKSESAAGKLKPILSNKTLFAVDLYETKVAEKVEAIFAELIAGPHTTIAVINKYLTK
ncbi:MAG: mannitol dehydrogenase family protein [Treponemataceae bacterium]|nr:MAG: mannitol dehydrogenase family protein [Treponemataceae bacterium]